MRSDLLPLEQGCQLLLPYHRHVPYADSVNKGSWAVRDILAVSHMPNVVSLFLEQL